MKEIPTSVEIDATPERVWDVLADFEAYGEWNPFARIAGKPNVGARPRVRLTRPNGRSMSFRPEILVADPNRELRWRGSLLVPGLFDGEHRFVLEPLDGGERTRLVHAETFSGILAGLLLRVDRGNTRAGFEAMNDALKRRAEGGVAAGDGASDGASARAA